MGVQHPRLASPSWVRLPRRTARLRLTAFYGGLFLLTGAALAAITYVLLNVRPTAHDATITAHTMPHGGLCVSVSFPLPARPSASSENHSQGDRHSLEIELATP